jgi:hypothetical protein
VVVSKIWDLFCRRCCHFGTGSRCASFWIAHRYALMPVVSELET